VILLLRFDKSKLAMITSEVNVFFKGSFMNFKDWGEWSIKSTTGKCQYVDTLVDVGGHRLHFHMLKGKGMPILFEAGSGAGGDVWDTILKPIADITGATLITYARAGFEKKSELDTTNHDLNRHGILNGIEGLE
jgi:hypothetical protein